MSTSKTDYTLPILTVVLSLLFLLISVRSSSTVENTAELYVLIAGRFIVYELFLFLSIYIASPMIADILHNIWMREFRIPKFIRHFLRYLHNVLLKSRNITPPVTSTMTTKESTRDNSIDRENIIDGAQTIYLTDEIKDYIIQTFNNILSPKQIDNLIENFQNFNTNDKFKVIEKVALPKFIFQFDILHLVWNICKRIYDKRYCNYKFRDRAAEFAKSSFPLTVTSTIEVISATMTNDDKTHSLPIIKPGEPLIPHDFNEVRERMAKKS